MPEKKIKVLHGYGFPNLVLYQKDSDTLTVKDEVGGETKFIDVVIDLEAKVGMDYVNSCLVETDYLTGDINDVYSPFAYPYTYAIVAPD